MKENSCAPATISGLNQTFRPQNASESLNIVVNELFIFQVVFIVKQDGLMAQWQGA
jgi:hypothetical protein